MISYCDALLKTLESRERYADFLAKLETLKSTGKVTAEQYVLVKDEYQHNLLAADQEVSRIKSYLVKQLDSSEQEVKNQRFELRRLSTRHKVGELTASQFTESDRKLRVQLVKTIAKVRELETLINARSVSDITA